MTGAVADRSPRAEDAPRAGLARWVTDVLAPAHLVIGLLPVVGAATSPSLFAGILWGAAAAVFAGAVPYGVILYGVRAGRWSDRHVRVRRQRIVPLLLSVASVVGGLGTLAAAGCPSAVVALVVAMLAGLVVTVAVTLVWKISVHTAVAGGSAAVLTVTLGPVVLLPAVAAVGAIGWSRVKLGDHTLAQILAGAVMGAAVALLVYPPLR